MWDFFKQFYRKEKKAFVITTLRKNKILGSKYHKKLFKVSAFDEKEALKIVKDVIRERTKNIPVRYMLLKIEEAEKKS